MRASAFAPKADITGPSAVGPIAEIVIFLECERDLSSSHFRLTKMGFRFMCHNPLIKDAYPMGFYTWVYLINLDIH